MKHITEITDNCREVWNTLKQSLEAGSFPQSILIEGVSGIGKKALAMELGIVLMCQNSETDPCGTCFSCVCASKEEGPNFIWAPPIIKKANEDLKNRQHRDAAIKRVVNAILHNPYDLSTIPKKSYISVDMVRDLKEQLSYKDKFNRVVFIPEADKMNKNAANALLKVLEEVPNNCYFILTTSSKSTLLPTILSRCLQVHIPSMKSEEMVSVLEKYEYSVVDRELLCTLAEGAPGQAMALLNMEYRSIRKEAVGFLQLALQKKYPQLLKQVDGLGYEEEKGIALCDFLYMIVHDLYLMSNSSLSKNVRNADIADTLKELGELIGDDIERLYTLMKTIMKYRQRLFTNAKTSIALGALGLELG